MKYLSIFIRCCFAGTGAIVRLPQCQWSKPDGYGKISQCITITKHNKAKTVCIFLGIYCRCTLHFNFGLIVMLQKWWRHGRFSVKVTWQPRDLDLWYTVLKTLISEDLFLSYITQTHGCDILILSWDNGHKTYFINHPLRDMNIEGKIQSHVVTSLMTLLWSYWFRIT